MLTTRYVLIAALTTLLTSTHAYSACTLKSAQTLMIEGTNMMQVYTRKNLDYVEQQQTPPASFQEKYDKLVEEHAELGKKMAEATEKKPNIQHEDEIAQSICDGYAAFLKKYSPDGYKGAAVKMEKTTADPNCTTNSLWEKYYVLIEKQTALVQAGKLSDKVNTDMMRLSTEIGESATTDLAKACGLVGEFEKMLNSVN